MLLFRKSLGVLITETYHYWRRASTRDFTVYFSRMANLNGNQGNPSILQLGEAITKKLGPRVGVLNLGTVMDYGCQYHATIAGSINLFARKTE